MELQNRREDRQDAGRQCPLILMCHNHGSYCGIP